MDDKILWDIIDGLRDEIRQLKADIRHDTKVCEDYDDGLLAEIKELKEDNKRLYQEHKECRLVEQVSSNSGNSSSTHTHKRR